MYSIYITICIVLLNNNLVINIIIWTICTTQVNAILLIISLVSLAKSQCGKVGDKMKDKQTVHYLEMGK